MNKEMNGPTEDLLVLHYLIEMYPSRMKYKNVTIDHNTLSFQKFVESNLLNLFS